MVSKSHNFFFLYIIRHCQSKIETLFSLSFLKECKWCSKKKKMTLVFQVSLSLFINSFLAHLVIFLLREAKTPLAYIFLIGISNSLQWFWHVQKRWDTADSSTGIHLKNILHQTAYASTLHGFHCIGYLLSLLL